ncbi:MAG: M23 family metallopeptidase [Allomuricauda sp.]|nr:MAG: M23 family metallopeptidase [Allomuricauda sp.]
MVKHLLGTFFFITLVSLNGQEKYPQDYFDSPLDIPIVLAGTFGELRSNHFHAGIDIKTQRRQGLPVYAVAEGTVTRIKVSHWGYGKALYIAHPNGYTSVYAHLQKFSPEIEAYLKKEQYKKKSFEIELFPKYGELSVDRREVVAFSGNTGGSSGPHLHFEIRSSLSEKPTNPLLYGYEVRDATDPSLVGLFGYPLSEGSHVNNNQEKVQLNFKKQPDGSFLADEVAALGTIGLGFNGFDRQDLAANKNGVFSVRQSVNGKVYSEYNFESFSFGESRYINTLIDYAHYAKLRQRVQKCFKEKSNFLSIYSTLYNDGKITIKEGLSYKVEILISDFKGNKTKVVVPIEGKKPIGLRPKNNDTTDSYLLAAKPNNFDLGTAKVYFPANTFYNSFYIDLEKGQDTVKIHNKTAGVHRNFTLTFDVSKYPENERQQMFIARIDDDGKLQYSRTFRRNSTFTTRTRNLGTYTIAKDTTEPKIRPRNFKNNKWLDGYHNLSLQISDDLSGIDTYTGTLNGEWILLEYEPKTKTITYNFDDRIADKTQCDLKVTVTDNVGNSSTFESTFFRK